MGTDIHFYVERRENGKWVFCDVWEPDEDIEEGQEQRLTVPWRKHFYDDRNYDVFAILADVRNGSGFAGCDTGDGFVPIAPPRGLPDDMSPELRTCAERRLEHTPSWLLVSEFMSYDWTQTTTKRGWVSAPAFYRWDKQREPSEYSGGIQGPRIEHVSPEQMQGRIGAVVNGLNYHDSFKKIESELGDVYTQVSWQTPYYRAASGFLSECLPRLWRLGPYEDVRCVFWFDS